MYTELTELKEIDKEIEQADLELDAASLLFEAAKNRSRDLNDKKMKFLKEKLNK